MNASTTLNHTKAGLTWLTKFFNNKKPDDFNDPSIVAVYHELLAQRSVDDCRDIFRRASQHFKFFPTPAEFREFVDPSTKYATEDNDLYLDAIAVQEDINAFIRSPDRSFKDMSETAQRIALSIAPSEYDLKRNPNYIDKINSVTLIKNKILLERKRELGIDNKNLLPAPEKIDTKEDEQINRNCEFKNPDQKVFDMRGFMKQVCAGVKEPTKNFIKRKDLNK